MLGVMYTINRNRSGIILACKRCSHAEPINQFDDRLGSRRSQAARAMLKHVRNEHGGQEPIGRPISQAMERWY
jgi:hypothetical protein